MVMGVTINEPRNLSLEEQQAATRQRIADRQRQWGFDVTEPAEAYRSPNADPPAEVAQLDDTQRAPLSEEEQVAWAQQTLSRNLGDFRAKTERAAPPLAVARPAPALAELRTQLAEAIQVHSQALLVAEECDQAVQHAKLQMQEADAVLGEFSELDTAISQFTIDSLKARRPVVLPEEMLTAQKLRAAAIDQARQIHAAHGHLLSEAQQTRVAVDQAATARNELCAQIMAATADAVAMQLREVDRRAAALRVTLRSIGDTWLALGGGISRSVGLSQHAREVLLRPRDEVTVDRDYSMALRNWYATLQTDPDAQLQA